MTLNAHVSRNAARMFATPPAPACGTGLRLVEERAWDAAARETLLDAAFGETRFAKTCERLREGRKPAKHLALVALEEGALVATLRFWHVDAGGAPALMLGPLAVAESHRAVGLGGDLMRYGLRRARLLGHRAVILVGDEPYYRRFGFRRDLTQELVMPGPVEAARFLGLELVEGALAGAQGAIVATGEMAVARWREHFRLAG